MGMSATSGNKAGACTTIMTRIKKKAAGMINTKLKKTGRMKKKKKNGRKTSYCSRKKQMGRMLKPQENKGNL